MRIAERRGASHLHRLLLRVDREAAGRLGPNDHQRIVRALEVFFTVRRGLSDLIREFPFGGDRYGAIKIGLEMCRERLYRLIDERVRAFFGGGLVEEVRGLLAAGHPPSANAFKALGYRETLRHLNGDLTLDEAIALARRNTRRYAKRQWTWFRKEEGVTWFDVDPSLADRFREPLAFVERALGHR